MRLARSSLDTVVLINERRDNVYVALIRRRTLTVVGAALLTALTVALAAAGGSQQKLYLGTDLHFTGPDSTAGTWVASGAIEDSGTAAVQHLALTPIADSGMARLSGDETFTSSKGSIVTSFEGQAFPATGPHQVGKGRFEIVSGTGAYAGIQGGGTFVVVADALSNQVIGTEEGSVEQ